MSNKSLRLVLGTAQLGMSYGIANSAGMPSFSEATAIVSKAFNKGVRYFDTAQAYGDSEEILGNILQELGVINEVNILSKISPYINYQDNDVVSRSIQESLERLGVCKLYGIMLHKENILDYWDEGLGEVLSSFKNSGVIKHIGVSVYTPNRASQALEISEIDLIQIPSSIFDRRFESLEITQKAKQRNYELHIRSVFLQGLLLMPLDQVPSYLNFIKPILNQFEELTLSVGLTKQEVALLYIREYWPNAYVLFGAENATQVSSNIDCWGKKIDKNVFNLFLEPFSKLEEKIIRPDRWKK